MNTWIILQLELCEKKRGKNINAHDPFRHKWCEKIMVEPHLCRDRKRVDGSKSVI